jgi:uncharacterized damage-inducible protein DinB
MPAETIVTLWKEVRKGLISEVEMIPAEQFSFRATPETRSITELLQHIVESQQFLVGETCRDNTNLRRGSFADLNKEYSPGVKEMVDKESLLELLKKSMDEAESSISGYCDKLDQSMYRFDGKQTSKNDFLTFAVSHEMYHRGQLTVYERLLNIEPVLTGRLKMLFGEGPA